MDDPVPQYIRKVIRIKAEDSPNVRYALAEIESGREPSNRIVLAGVLPYDLYKERREKWDPVRQSIGLEGLFWEGAESLLYPPTWLDRAEKIARELKQRVFLSGRKAEAMGVDPAQGGDKTAYSVGDKLGLIEQFAIQTPDTNEINKLAKWFGRKHDVDPKKWVYDSGGGGKQHADRLRAEGYEVQTVSFGESVSPRIRRGVKSRKVKVHEKEEKASYSKRRSEMYGKLRELMDPGNETEDRPGFGIPEEYQELRRQLSLFPYQLDEEGRMFLPPKRRRPGMKSSTKTLEDIMGCSPDESDSLVLMIYGLGVTERPRRMKAGAAW